MKANVLKAKSWAIEKTPNSEDTEKMPSNDSGVTAVKDETFQITVQPSGRMFAALAGETILGAGIRQGIGLPYGCKDGACGTCKCKKIEGVVEHGPHQSKALSEEEEANGYILTCCGVAKSDLLLESRQVTQQGALPIKKMPTRVSLMEKKSNDVMLLRLQLPANDSFRYHPGQYVEIILRDGARRSYSMANAPPLQTPPQTPAPDPSPTVGPSLELHIRHMPGGKFTDHVFGVMKEKEILRIEGPFGSFFLREESDKPMVLLASGTGFAPIKAVIEHMQRQGITRPATLYWGGRRPADLYMDEWVKTKVMEMPNLRYVPVVSNALPEDGWTGRTGFVHLAVLQDFPDLSNHQVYACGAPIVVDSARAAYIGQAGLPEDEFYADSFITEADKAHA
jgi:CDP-4-dehydro-6-deoxyglucose reductase